MSACDAMLVSVNESRWDSIIIRIAFWTPGVSAFGSVVKLIGCLRLIANTSNCNETCSSRRYCPGRDSCNSGTRELANLVSSGCRTGTGSKHTSTADGPMTSRTTSFTRGVKTRLKLIAFAANLLVFGFGIEQQTLPLADIQTRLWCLKRDGPFGATNQFVHVILSPSGLGHLISAMQDPDLADL